MTGKSCLITAGLRLAVLIMILDIASQSEASPAVVHVSSVPQMQSAINSSSPGDIIVLADGTYLNSSIVINKSNVTVIPSTRGGVFLNGTNNIDINGNYVTFSGFQFTSGDIGSSYLIEVSGNHCILSQLNFNGYHAKKYIQINAGTQYNEVSFCNIENKPVAAVIGCTIQINTSPTIPGYHKIRYCSFKNFPGPGGDYGNEPVRIGLSTEMTNVSRSVVEFCFFTNVGPGDSESISVKSSENICRYNTFSDNPQGMLVFRHGYRNIAYSNFFIKGSGGIRIKEGADHYVYNNYFETGSADAVTLQFVIEYPLNNINFINNTFVNSGDIDLGGTGIANVTFANNIFKKSSGNIFSNPNGQTVWMGNLFNGTPGIPPVAGLTNIDPLLEINPDGYYGLSPASPAINASAEGYPPILDIAAVDDDPSLIEDISGQSRPALISLKDIGCDEFTTGQVKNRPLSPENVGPSYLGGPATSADKLRNSITHCCLYPNPASGTVQLNYNLSAMSDIRITIFNITGLRLSDLTEIRNQSPGSYTWHFEVTDLTDGIYIVRIKSDIHSSALKLIVRK